MPTLTGEGINTHTHTFTKIAKIHNNPPTSDYSNIVLLKSDIKTKISSTELSLCHIRGLRYWSTKKVDLIMGHLVPLENEDKLKKIKTTSKIKTALKNEEYLK